MMDLTPLLGLPLAHYDGAARDVLRGVLAQYDECFECLRTKHPQYRAGWHAHFMAPHRYVNRVVLLVLAALATPGLVVADVGTYDGMLVAALRAVGIEAYGYDAVQWPEMWRALGVEQWMNKGPEEVDVVVALNYVHRFTPDGAVQSLQQECHSKSIPALVIGDAEVRNRAPLNALWVAEETLRGAGWRSWGIPACAATKHVDLQRRLLTWGSL